MGGGQCSKLVKIVNRRQGGLPLKHFLIGVYLHKQYVKNGHISLNNGRV